MTDAGEKLERRIGGYYAEWLKAPALPEIEFKVFIIRAELERAAGIADDCQCDRSAKCSCADHAAAIRKLKE